VKFIVYTDGGCSGNKRGAGCPGGYGYVILDPSNTIILKGGGHRINVTNNQMELLAVIQGLTALKKELDEAHGGASAHSCIVRPDSQYVSENYTAYLPDWKKRGWRKSNGKRVLNSDLWKQLDKLTPEFKSVGFKWVKGHASNKFNNMVDAIVQEHTAIAKGS